MGPCLSLASGPAAASVLVLVLLTAGCALTAAKECTNIPTQNAARRNAMLALLGHFDEHSRNSFANREEVGQVADLSLSSSPSKSLRRVLRDRQADFIKRRMEQNRFAAKQDFLKEFSLHDVRLHPESPQGTAQEVNLQYLLMLDVDRLIWSFRHTAGFATPGVPYGGWEMPISELRGHFVGHYLSAAAFAWASTGNSTLELHMKTVVAELAKCQDSMGSGYLSAFPTEFFDRVEAVLPVWAPYYTIHKIMAGLLDQFTVANNVQAFHMLLKMVDYFRGRVDAVIAQHTIERWWRSLNEEFGGMNDLLYRLYAITGDEEHARLAHQFDKPCFLGPLALQTDDLSGLHSNTHIPLIVGAQMRYEVIGDSIYKDIAEYFMELINSTHGFATGGTSSNEFWHDPHRLGSDLGQEDQETCTTYNMLKVSRNMFRWRRDVAHMDYFERLVTNGILGIQRGTQPGVMIYMLPLGAGNSKAMGYHGWGNPFNAFWCCYGTGIESFAKLGDSIYFYEEGSPPGLYVVQFVASTLRWKAAGLHVQQRIKLPSAVDPAMNVTISFSTVSLMVNSGRTLAAVTIRIPGWAAQSSVALNGDSLRTPPGGNFLKLRRVWNSGDQLQLTLPISLRTEAIEDDRKEYSTMRAILFGPHVLVGLTPRASSLALGLNPATPSEWLTPIPPSANAALVTLELSLPAVKHIRSVSGATADMKGTILRYCDVGGEIGEVQAWPTPEDGTQEAMEATFRIVSIGRLQTPRSDAHESDRHRRAEYMHSDFDVLNWQTLIGKTVLLEVFSRPGLYLGHNGVGQPLTFIKKLKHATNIESNAASEDRHDMTISLSSEPRGVRHAAAFHVRQGLINSEAAVSFEASDLPGNFLSMRKLNGGASGHSLSLLKIAEDLDGLVTGGETAHLSSFIVRKGLATYNNISFVAPGNEKDFLLMPISAMRDEQYTTYFSFS